MPLELSKSDVEILKMVQSDATLSTAAIAEKINLSQSPCWRRIKRLEGLGVIKKQVALLDPQRLDLNVTVHAYIVIKKHDEESLTAFESAVQNVKDIVECYSTSGEKDYVLKIKVSSVSHYEQLLKEKLVQLPNVASVNSTFALKQVKYSTALPL